MRAWCLFLMRIRGETEHNTSIIIVGGRCDGSRYAFSRFAWLAPRKWACEPREKVAAALYRRLLFDASYALHISATAGEAALRKIKAVEFHLRDWWYYIRARWSISFTDTVDFAHNGGFNEEKASAYASALIGFAIGNSPEGISGGRCRHDT